MIPEALYIATLFLIIGLFCGLYRLFVGPGSLNRLLAFDFLSACIIGLIVLHSIKNESIDYLELILIFSLVGFAVLISFLEAFFSQLKRKEIEAFFNQVKDQTMEALFHQLRGKSDE